MTVSVTMLYYNSKISNEKPYLQLYTGDFNAHSVHWWPNGDNNDEGTQLNILFNELRLDLLISEPTHFREHCDPTCIDLILCDQPNIVINSGVHPSLDESCKHQIIHCKLNINHPKVPPYEKKLWHYDAADRDIIHRTISDFDWEFHLNQIPDPNTQVDYI